MQVRITPITAAIRQGTQPVNPDTRIQTSSVRVTAAGKTPPLKLRPVGTLKADARFVLKRAQTKENFLYFFTNNFIGVPEYFWASVVSQLVFPNLEQKPIKANQPREFGKTVVKDYRDMLQAMAKAWTEVKPAHLISIKKDPADKTFTVKVPVQMIMEPERGFGLGVTGLAIDGVLASGKSFADLRNEDLGFQQKVMDVANAFQGTHTFPLTSLVVKGSVNQKAVEYFKSTNAKLTIQTITQGGRYLISVEFTGQKHEAEHLTNSSWLEIRPLDLYGPLRSWVSSYFGRYGRPAQFAIPLGRIAASVHKDSPARLNEDNCLCDHHGQMYCIPKELNDITKFEEAFATALQRSDGTFSLTALPGEQKPVMPPAMPVLVDWTNLKFAYTTNEGNLAVMPLDRSVPATVTHARRFLELKITDDRVMNFISLTIALASLFSVQGTPSRDDMLREILRMGRERDEFIAATEIPFYCIQEYAIAGTTSTGLASAPSGLCANFVSAASQVINHIKANPANAYKIYSVTSVLNLQANLIAFTKYGINYQDTKIQDNTARRVYLEQGKDENFQPEAIPFVLPNRGLMPHQFKVLNQTRERPDNALLDVQAGGGKTTLIIVDVLKEMKLGTRPFLVMCPSHLVAQYVKEFAYFTGNKINVIAVSSFTVRRFGLEKLKAMIQNAPVNTVIVSDYNVVSLGAYDLSYGGSATRVYPVIEFLRQFGFQYVACDESHFLRNTSGRNAAVSRLIADIPKKRLASGTVISNTIIDVVTQTSLLDPTVFGTTADFIKEFALEEKGGKVLQWKPGTELEVSRRLQGSVVIAKAARKEWAAILPYPRERFHPCELSPKQKEVYSAILAHVVEAITSAAESNETLKLALSGDAAALEEIDIDGLLKPYLARIEQFLTAPGHDELGKLSLTGDDALSPKAREIVSICQKHVAENIAGKVLIFTNYHASAQAVYDAFPPELQKHVIYYTASNKDACGAEFDKNPDKLIMVGVEQSMNTGLNLQVASRLIRCETVWTPGILEQGNSRIGRPNVKEKENRSEIFYDWVIVNKTIDVTKISYLMAKSISKAKFDEAGNSRFDELEVPPLFNMTLDNIISKNDWETDLLDYYNNYEAYKQALWQEYADYRVKNKEILFNADGSLKMHPIEVSPNLEGAELMARLPYVPGLELYDASKLGLVRYDEFMRLEETGDDSEEDESEEDNSALAEERTKALGMHVHTDMGDGEIVRVMNHRLRVRLPSGETIAVRKMSAFIITKAETSAEDVRTQLLKLTGDVPIDAPVKVLKVSPAKQKTDITVDTPAVEDAGVSFQLSFTVFNDFLGIVLDNTDDDSAARAAQAIGFKFTPAYYYTVIRNPEQYLRLFKLWTTLGFEIDPDNTEACKAVYTKWKSQGKAAFSTFGVAAQNNLKNFLRTDFKPNANAKHINPYPILRDGKVYIALPKTGHPGSRAAVQKSAAVMGGLRWMQDAVGAELIAFALTKPKASQIIHNILNAGITISNIQELKGQFRKLRTFHSSEKE